MNNDYLFPLRLTRRDFLQMGGAAAAAVAMPCLGEAAAKAPVTFGRDKFIYTLDESWGKLPAGMKYGYGCGVVVDSRDRIYVTSRSENPCVAIFDKEGKLLETWSNEFAQKVGMNTSNVAATAHCVYWSKEGGDEFLYFTENVAGGKDSQPKIGARVYKTDLTGKVLYTLGNVEQEGSTSQKFDFTNPTDVVVAANGDVYVVDGYGSQRVSRFDKNFTHIKTFGAKGKENDQFNTCHGVWVSTLNKEPEIYIADRHNSRLQVYSLELDYKRTVSGDFVRNPCCFYQHEGHLYIPDLAAMVVIIDSKDQPVAILGDGKNVPKEEKEMRPEFIAPHALTVDSEGSIYVVEWVPDGRPRKFKRAA